MSFGGRAQLINSVLFSVQVYWSSIFILPKKTMKEIESLLSAFLWKGLELKYSGTKVAWTAVCVPKGGLGFKRLIEWNKASMLRHLWAISKREDILNRCIWSLDLPQDSSWTVRKIFGLHKDGQRFIQHRIGNGGNTFLWIIGIPLALCTLSVGIGWLSI